MRRLGRVCRFLAALVFVAPALLWLGLWLRLLDEQEFSRFGRFLEGGRW